MRTTIQWLGASLLMLAAYPTQSQAPAPAATAAPAPAETRTFTSMAEITAMMAKANSERATSTPIGGGNLLHLAPYNLNLEYRTAVGNAAIHETDAELFIVVEGTGTGAIGGQLVAPVTRTGATQSAKTSQGGVTRAVAKGEVFIVPENTAPWFNRIDGTLVLMSMHVPRPVPAGH